VFNPDRFLGSNPELDPRAYIFGFGRRICPGRLFGEATIFLAVSNVLSTLDVIKAVDASGQEIIPELEYSEGVVTYVLPCFHELS
jgi:cytochrome P450